jgi:hypothetical protein
VIEGDIEERMAGFAPSQRTGPSDLAREIMSQQVAGPSMEPTVPEPSPLAREIMSRDNDALMSSMMGAVDVNPDEAAKASRIGSQFGVGQDIALRNMPEMEHRARMMELQRMRIQERDPILAELLSEQAFARMAHDDLGTLTQLQPLVFEAAMLQTPGGFFRVVGRGYERGRAISERGDIGTRVMAGFAGQADLDRAKQLTEEMQALGQQGILGSTAEIIAQNVGQLRTIGTTTVAGAAAGGILGPAGAVAGGAIGATAGIVASTGTMEAGNLYLDMREQGVSDDAAIPAAVAGGFLNGVIEAVGMKIAAKPFRALASKVIREEVAKAVKQPTMRAAFAAGVRAYGLQVGTEATEEGLQEIVAVASEELAKAADGIDSETSLRDAAGRVIEAFAYGGMAASLLGGVGPGANLVVDLRRANATQRQQAFFDGLAENRKESKLAQRNPQGYERFLAAQANGTPAETIYVDAVTARDILAQSGTTTAQLEDILPGIRERLEKAVETGGDVTIPTSQFGARLANTELGNALLPHMRLAPEAMSAAEAQAFEAQRQAVVEEARTILATKQEADAAFVAEAQQVEDEAFEQIRSVGQFTDIEARTIAKLRQAMVVVDAAEAGMTPAQYQRERGVPLQVRGEGMAAPAVPKAVVEEVALPPIEKPEGMEQTLFDDLLQRAEVDAGNRSSEDDYAIVTRRRALSENLGNDAVRVYDEAVKRIVARNIAAFRARRAAETAAPSVTLEQAATLDANYLAAVERGDTATAQRMVDEASGQPGQEAVTRDEAGNIVPLSRRFDITSPKLFEQAAVVPTTIDAASNVESSFAFAGTQTFRNNRQFKKAIQDRVNTAARDAGIDLTQFTPEVEQYLVRVAVADAITALRTNPNAVGWYNEKVTKALRLVSLIHPEIATDPRAKFAFTWALAVTSNGLKVDKNFELAERAYAEYKRTGKMPTNIGAGTAQIAINESLGLFNELVEKYGIDEVEKFMTSKTTVKEVIAYTNKNVSGENLTTEVYGAAALGPKIGNGFFANLYGHFEQLTMDRWLMRTWGRWTGTLLEDNERNIVLKRQQLAGIIKAMPAKNKKQLEAIVGMSLATDDLDALATAINKASLKRENRIEMAKIGVADDKAQAKFSKILGEPTRGVQRISYGDEFRKLGNSLAKYLDGQKEAPSGPPERARIRKVFAQALAELQTQFPSLTMSDLQALLWYPEKRLYDAAKTADEGQTGYEDNAAPDYANSAAKLALAKGISQDVVNATIGEVDAELAAIAAERTAGAERGIGNLVLRQDARLAGAGFEQATRSPARGGIDPRTLNVLVGKGGDVSTLVHELIHLRIGEYLRMARSATPPARVTADLDILFGFMGVKGDTFQERLDNYETMPLEQRRPLEEKVTYNAEIYVYEGKAPSVELRGVFDRLAAWMRRVYKSIRDDLNAIYRREFGTDLPILTPEVRSVFDRMLASEEQIKRQEAIEGMKGLFQTQAESGMADAEWAAYQAMQQEATEAAVTDLNTASMRQLQWLGNARARILRDLQKKHDAKRKEVTAEVAAAVKVEPVYRAMTYLRYGRFVDTDGQEVEVEGTHRLDIEKVRAMYAGMPSEEAMAPTRAAGFGMAVNVRPDIMSLGTGKYGMLGKDGLDPDMVAEMFGYSSGDEMVRAMLAAKPMKETVAERTDAEMLRRYGDMNTPAALEAEVQKALHNEARARMVAVQLRFVSKAQTPVRVMLEAAKQVASDMISDTTIRNLRPNDFVAAEARAARDSEYLVKYEAQPRIRGRAEYDRVRLAALAAGSTEEDANIAATAAQEAFIAAQTEARSQEFRERFGPTTPQEALIRAQRAQLYQNQLAAEALRVKEYVDKQVKYLRRVLRDENVKRMGAAAADQVAGLLERFEVAQVSLKRLEERRSMAQFLADLEAAGVVPDIAEEIANEARRVNYKELKVSEFRDLVDAVRQIEHVGKNEQKMRLAEERAAFEEVRDEIVTRIRAVGKVRGLKVDPRTPLTGIGRAAAFLRGFAAQHLKAASVARVLDGGKEDGPLWNAIIRTANDASDMETRMRAEASLKLGEILKPVFALGGMGGKGMYFPSIGSSLNREARIAIALNLGNDGNRQRLLDGEGWTLEQLQPVLESLTEAEWQAVQQVWDFIDGYRPEIAAKERRLYGKEPEWVTPVPFTVRTSDGKEVSLQGGYYPVKYDPVASDRVATVDAAEEAKRDLQGAYTAATTRRSFVKTRAKEVRDRPILYTLDAAFSGVNDVIHDLAWHEWLISTNRLLRDVKFANAVRETRGPEFLKQLRDWTKDNATGARGQQVAGESVLSWLRQGISASGLGFNVVSAAMQVTGFNQSIVRVGAKYVGQGIVQFSTSPFESAKTVAEKSSFMAERGRTQFREINEIKNRVRGQTEVARRVTAGTYFLMMNMQRSVDIPTWLGAYQKALDAGKDDARAVALADQAVRDSQGSGLVSDLAAVERGGPAMKLFTVFYSYMNTVYNMTAVQTMTARGKGKLAADYAMLLVVPVVLGYAIKSAIQPDAGDDELDPEALARKLAAEELSYLMGTMVIVREFGGAAQLLTGAEGVRMGYGGPAGLRAVGEVYGLATQAGQLEFDRAFRRSAINTLGAFTGLPSAQINRTIDGIEALVEGEVEGPSAVLAPLTGVQR